MKYNSHHINSYSKVPCPLCGSSDANDYTVLYAENIPSQKINPTIFSARRMPDKVHYQIVKCKNDSLVRSTPILTTECLDMLYTQSKVTYINEVDNLSKTYLRALEPILRKLSSNSSILEIGCGSGFMIEALQNKGFTNTYGIEPSVDAVARIKPLLRKNIYNAVFNKKLFSKDQKFDCIYLFQTLDHIPDVSKFIDDCYDLLHNGGYIFSFHHNVEAVGVSVLGEAHPIFDIEHTQLFSSKTSAAIFEKSGFLIDAISHPKNVLSLYHLCTLLPLPHYMKKNMLHILERFKILNVSIELPLGNCSVIAHKPSL